MASPLSNFSLLTDDLLFRILDKITSTSDRKNFRLVSKDFHRFDSIHRKTLKLLRLEFANSLLHKFSQINALDLSTCPRIDDATISSILLTSRFSNSLSWTLNIKKLVLSNATGLRSKGLELLMRFCINLEAIDVSDCWEFGDLEACALACGLGLREVRMDKCVKVTDVGLARIVVGCGKLERLSLRWCMEISDLGIDLLSKKCHHLRFLDISYLKVTNRSLFSIASLGKLKSLSMVGCSLLDDVGMKYLGRGCPLLQVLDVSRCNGISSYGLTLVLKVHSGLQQLGAGYCFADLSADLIYSLKNLGSLNLIKFDGARLSDSKFLSISLYCKQLVEVGLSKCIGVADEGIIQLASGCVNLKILDLTCCNLITDIGISAIADCCTNLVSLKVESCNLITEKGLERLGHSCLLIEELDLTDCSGVDDTGLCTNVHDKGLSHIGQNFSMICELDLYRCEGIRDEGLAALSGGCRKLKILNLSYCRAITDEGIQHLSNFEDLSVLEMRSLINITCSGMTIVAAGCKKLLDLDLKFCRNIDDSGFWALAYYSRNLQQINISHCGISDVGLCMVLGNLTCLQDAKLLHLTKVSVEGFELALRACYMRLKKVKLLSSLRSLLSAEILKMLQGRGCKIKWH
ncbi:Leucine-rich repeat [Dillenia turbinata]|uniref:Leucine-rich repeat n=1 Tax=Dillenia turbinata TaxID=194707 RepID=A0AAN8YUG7_9MAGN